MKSKQMLWFNIAILIGLIIVVILFNPFSDTITLEIGDTSLTISVSDDFSREVAFDDIATAVLTDITDYGEAADTSDHAGSKNCLYGTYSNAQWGQYLLLVLKNVDNCIVLTLENGEIIVFNYESTQATSEFFRALCELLDL